MRTPNGIHTRLTRMVLAGAALAALTGCGATATAPSRAASNSSSRSHDHSGWWCAEHGVPEEVCALCSVRLAAEFQRKGDWCRPHDRPDSQCFVCHPELQAEFAARYEAKYGTQPPKPEG